MACARTRREYIRGHDVSIFFVLRHKEAIQPMFLIHCMQVSSRAGCQCVFLARSCCIRSCRVKCDGDLRTHHGSRKTPP
jgi:hypothetical protein